MIKILVNKIIDWLIAFFLVTIILWFTLTQPVYSGKYNNNSSLDINHQELRKHAIALVEDYTPRTIEFGNLNITAHYIYDELKKFGEVSYHPFSTLGGQYSNVVLELGPETREVFVIGAHYDSGNSSLDTEGNASGVATLIELARQLSLNENKLSLRVNIVAYPLSQLGTASRENMGSYNHAAELKRLAKKVHLMISLDGVGRFNEQHKSQEYPFNFMHLLYPDQGNYISVQGRLQDSDKIRELKRSFAKRSDLPLYSFSIPSSLSAIKSIDHLNYQTHGFPAVVLSDTAKYRMIKTNTVIEQLDFNKIGLLVKGLYQVVIDANKSQADIDLVDNHYPSINTRRYSRAVLSDKY